MLICTLATSICLCACKDNTEQPPADLRDADWIKRYRCGGLQQSPNSTIIRSVEDIYSICDEDTSPIFKKNDNFSNQEAIEALKEYDESFFINKSLVLIVTYTSYGDYYVKNCKINDTTLNVTIANEVKKDAAYPAILHPPLVFVLEVPKTLIKNVTQVNVNKVYIEI